MTLRMLTKGVGVEYPTRIYLVSAASVTDACPAHLLGGLQRAGALLCSFFICVRCSARVTLCRLARSVCAGLRASGLLASGVVFRSPAGSLVFQSGSGQRRGVIIII